MLFLLFLDSLFEHLQKLFEFFGKKLFVAVIVQITFSITFGKPSPELFRKIFRCFDPLEIFSENLARLLGEGMNE